MTESVSSMHAGGPHVRRLAPRRGGGLPRTVGPHEIVGVLSMSAANEVLLATTRGPRGFVRPVVIKRVRDPDPGDTVATSALAREALAYARLNHPCVVQLYEVIEEEGQLALVLEYVPGAALARLRTRMAKRGEALDDGAVLYVMACVFAALAAAHEARDPWTGEFVPVVHRDVNPNNVLVSWDGVVKLTDFGIAKVTGVASDTRVGLLKGTYGYMAPEQVMGEPITPRTDVYCACLMLRELLVRRRNFDRRGRHELELMQEMAAPMFEPVERLRQGVPPVIAGALRIGLEMDPDARVLSAAEMRDVLSAYVRPGEGREKLAAALAGLRPSGGEGAEGSVEQSATTGQHAPIPMRPSLPTLDERDWPPMPPSPLASTRSIPSAPVTVPAPVATPSPTPSVVAAPRAAATALPRPLPNVSVETPQAMLHSIAPPPESAHRPPPRPAPSAVRVAWLVAACLIAALGLTATLSYLGKVPSPVVASAPDHPRRRAPSVRTAVTSSVRIVVPSAAAPFEGASGVLLTPNLADSHRIFVDGQVVGATGQPIGVRCGPHTVRVGSHGRPQAVIVPCGGQLIVQPMW